jgi:hypothetical protein
VGAGAARPGLLADGHHRPDQPVAARGAPGAAGDVRPARSGRAGVRRPGRAAPGRRAVPAHADRLEEKGLITRERSEADGRAVVVTLTDAGRAALDAALPDHLETERALLAGLSDDDRVQLAALLRRFLVSLGRLPQEP